MADFRNDLKTLRDPMSIKQAGLASSPYVLRKIFADDPIIRRLIVAGEQVLPLIAEDISREEPLDDITLSALAFVIENVNADAAPRILGATFRKALENPGPFFVHFAAHAIRSGLRLPIKPLEITYSRSELIETQNMLR
jgi:hypothetical protein